MSGTDLIDLPVLDRNTIDELREIMEENFTELVETFLQDLPIELAKVDEAVENREPEALYYTAHHLKSSSGSMGALQLAELLAQLETLGSDGSIIGSMPLMEQARTAAEQTRIALKMLLEH